MRFSVSAAPPALSLCLALCLGLAASCSAPSSTPSTSPSPATSKTPPAETPAASPAPTTSTTTTTALPPSLQQKLQAVTPLPRAQAVLKKCPDLPCAKELTGTFKMSVEALDAAIGQCERACEKAH